MTDSLYQTFRRASRQNENTGGDSRLFRSKRLNVERLESRTPVSTSALGLAGAAILGELLAEDGHGVASAIFGKEVVSSGDSLLAQSPERQTTAPRTDVWEDREIQSIIPFVPGQPRIVALSGEPASPEFDAADAILERSAKLESAVGVSRLCEGILDAIHAGLDVVPPKGAPPSEGAVEIASSNIATRCGFSVTMADDIPSGGPAQRHGGFHSHGRPDGSPGDPAEETGANGDSNPDTEASEETAETTDSLVFRSSDCGDGCGCDCNTAPYLGTEDGYAYVNLPPSEIYFNATNGSSCVDLPSLFCDAEQSDLTLGYSLVSSPQCVSAAVQVQSGRAKLVLTATGTAGQETITVRATDNGGLTCDWSVLVAACRVVGYEVQELAWGGSWSTVEDNAGTWDVLWNTDNHRWRPIVEPSAAVDNVLSVAFSVAGASQPFAQSAWEGSACAGSTYDYDRWAYGTPGSFGEVDIAMAVQFGPTVGTFVSQAESIGLTETSPSALQPRIGVVQITSLEWVAVSATQTVAVAGVGDVDLAEVAAPTTAIPYWQAYPEYETPGYNEVCVSMTVSSVPSDMVASAYLAWYDPNNTLANLAETPSTTGGEGLRDNEYGLADEGPSTLQFTSTTSTVTAVYQINGASYGDNYIVAAHPRQGVASDYEFALDTTCECGCGVGDVVLSYLALADPADPQSGTVRRAIEAMYPRLATSYLNTSPVFDIDTDSDNDGSVTHWRTEQDLEDVDGNGVNQVGKRIFVNTDDDNMNGKSDACDRHVDYGSNCLDNDFALITVDLTGEPINEGYQLRLFLDAGLCLWASPTKESVFDLSSPLAPDGSSNRPEDPYNPQQQSWYLWNLDATFPVMEFYVEGVTVGEKHITCQLVNATGTPVAGAKNDIIEINVEKVVWPSNETGETWKSQPTSNWDGFELSEGWFIEKSLCDLINGTNTGYIRTHYRTTQTDTVLGTVNQYTGLMGETSHAIQPAKSTAGYTNGFEMIVTFEFDGPEYVETYHRYAYNDMFCAGRTMSFVYVLEFSTARREKLDVQQEVFYA